MFVSVRRALLSSICLSALTASLLTTGCGAGTPASVSAAATAPVVLSGSVHGGQQPLAHARVYLIGVSSDNSFGSGYKAYDMLGGAGASTYQKFTNTIYTNPAGYSADSIGTYVFTDANGQFTLNGISMSSNGVTVLSTYQCDADVVTYVLVLGGNPGLASGTNNSAIAEMAEVAPCSGNGPGGDGTLGASRFINVNEATTIAGAYALAGYMTGPVALMYSGTTLGATGLTNAGNNAGQLVDSAGGGTLSTTPNGAAAVPAQTVNALANILSACVNTATPTSPTCATLFANATANGTATGTQPADTLTAALNLAHHPGGFGSGSAGSVAQLFSLVNAVPAFGNTLTAAPNDWTLALQFAASQKLVSATIPAVDASGNVWFASAVPFTPELGGIPLYSVEQVSPLGGYNTEVLVNNVGSQMAVDASGNGWTAYRTGGQVTKATGTNAFSYEFDGGSNDDGHQIAIDPTGNVYVQDFTNGNVYKLSSGGSVTATSSDTSYDPPTALAMLSASDVVIASYDTYYQLDGLQTTNLGDTPICRASDGSPEPCFEGGLLASTALATDGHAHIWALNPNSTLSAFASGGDGVSGSPVNGSPFSGGGLNTTTVSPNQPSPWLAIDGGGNIWVSNYTGTLSEFSNTGSALSPATGLYGTSTSSCKGQGAAIDGSGNVWVGCDSTSTPFVEYIGLATPVATPLLPGNFGVRP